MKQYVYDVIDAECADMIRRGRADMVDMTAGLSFVDEQLAQLASFVSDKRTLVEIENAFRVLQTPVPAVTIRLTEAFDQAKSMLLGQPSRWSDVPLQDKVHVHRVLARCDAVICCDISQAVVRSIVIGEAFETIRSMMPAAATGLAAGFGATDAMIGGARARSVALRAALEVLGAPT